ncbi:hypothetical protein OESDEN_07930 [Oesophagostomum dentatum]|uniref:Uncharacterized protein n=1 Tax=Oesophagostomum dentatum TaxID=61180 RepID=A0A0B1T3S3_OESDE|nr:hypothetical protein OESDEN_07930 [Oesophagostomum dentatum]
MAIVIIQIDAFNMTSYYNCFLEHGGDLYLKSKENFTEDPSLSKYRVEEYTQYHGATAKEIAWNLTGFAQHSMNHWKRKAKPDETEFGCGYSSQVAAKYSTQYNTVVEERLACIFK